MNGCEVKSWDDLGLRLVRASSWNDLGLGVWVQPTHQIKIRLGLSKPRVRVGVR